MRPTVFAVHLDRLQPTIPAVSSPPVRTNLALAAMEIACTRFVSARAEQSLRPSKPTMWVRGSSPPVQNNHARPPETAQGMDDSPKGVCEGQEGRVKQWWHAPRFAPYLPLAHLPGIRVNLRAFFGLVGYPHIGRVGKALYALRKLSPVSAKSQAKKSRNHKLS